MLDFLSMDNIYLNKLLHWETQMKIFLFHNSFYNWGFPDSSVGKVSTGNAGNPGLIPGSGRSPGEGIGYPLQYSCAFLWLSW